MSRYVRQFGILDGVSFDGVTSSGGNYSVEDAAKQAFAWSGIGQYTDQINPCSFLRFVGAIANGGVATAPYVVEKVQVGNSTTYQARTVTGQRLLSENTARVLREYMGNNVTAKYGADRFPDLSVAAKSGTGEVGGGKRPNAMFTGFVTDADLPLAFICCVEDGGYGATVCIPVLSKVLTACKQMLH
jgi:peptidoglycan glycosyltransferase